MTHKTTIRLLGAAVATLACLAAAAPASAADGCDGVSLSLQTTGSDEPLALEVPFDDGVAAIATSGRGERQLVLHESCSPRHVTFDLAAGPGRAAGRCSIYLQGSEATGGCAVDGREERAVSGFVRLRDPQLAGPAPEETGHGNPPAPQSLTSP